MLGLECLEGLYNVGSGVKALPIAAAIHLIQLHYAARDQLKLVRDIVLGHHLDQLLLVADPVLLHRERTSSATAVSAICNPLPLAASAKQQPDLPMAADKMLHGVHGVRDYV